jgi:hypothetical protein
MNKFNEWLLVREANAELEDRSSKLIGLGLNSDNTLRFQLGGKTRSTGSPVIGIKAFDTQRKNQMDQEIPGNLLWIVHTGNKNTYLVSMDAVTSKDVVSAVYGKGGSPSHQMAQQAQQYQQFASQNPDQVIGGKKGSAKIIK